MSATGRVLFRLGIAIAVLVGGGLMFHSNPQVQTGGLAILVGALVVGLALHWIFRD